MTKAFRKVSRRWFLGGLMAGGAGTALAGPPAASIRPAPRPGDIRKLAVAGAEDLIAEARLSGKVGFAVADARSGEMLEAHNPLLGLPPASVTKAVTALYALETLGAEYRFRTRLVGTGPVVGGELKGDLVLVGGGDPTLNTDMLGDLAARLKAAGVHAVKGRFLYHAGALPALRAIDPGQPDHVGYNPAISGLNLNFNRVHFEWRRAASGYTVTMDARAQRYRPEVSMADMQVVSRDMPVYTYSSKGGIDHWTVASGALGKGGARWLPVRRPALYAAEVFQTLARSHGIALGRPAEARAVSEGTLLAEMESEPLREVLRGMLKYSTNITAEAVGLTASLARGKRVTSLAASGREMSAWLAGRLGTRKAAFVDHSGLGGGSRLSAGDMVRALAAVGPEGPLKPILKDVYLRDENGRALKTHPVKIRAKTGTLNFVSALAGYVTCADGRELAFAVLTADTDRRAEIEPEDRERPEGSRAWIRRSRAMQLDLVERWATLYAG
ncbi:MAG: D-alanyl-D-alanine carboxypeptidase/D-alanyl-D-alanine endopeptidase [Paracoccaceae bacterium]